MFRLQSLQSFEWKRQGPWLGTVLAVLLAGGLPRGAASQVTGAQAPGAQALMERGRKAGADVGRMRAVARRARRSGLSREASASLLRPAVRLAEQGLPAGPLLTKTLEGLAKQVPPDRLQSFLQEQRAFVQRAGRVVGQWPPAQKRSGANRQAPGDLITAAAETLRKGVPAEDIEALLNGLPGEADGRRLSTGQVVGTVGTLPDLLGRGARPETARRLLTSAIGAGYDAESIRRLPSALQSARRESKRPVGALAEGAAKAIARGAPATRVLGGLFPGGLPGGGLPARAGPPGTTPGVGKPPDPGPPGGES